MKNRIYVETKDRRFDTAPELYGLFFEDINRAADGGLYPEMIRNRAFEDSLIPEGCTSDEEHKVIYSEHGWPGPFNGGEGMDDWIRTLKYTPVPGWYVENAEMKIDRCHTLNENRMADLEVSFQKNGELKNIGYKGVYVEQNAIYDFYFMVQCTEKCSFTISIADADGEILAQNLINTEKEETYQRLSCKLKSSKTEDGCVVCIKAEKACKIRIGFTSLMPEKTFKNHGLREDLALALKNTNAKFIRFPGGCVVEGINEENALRFSRTIGPVWERPSCWVMWHYRTTNGLGFHEYLQLCEDLEMEAMYVCNCGMDCQARCGGGFTEKLTDEYLEEAMHALEYAFGDENTRYGRMRIMAGHPEPFNLKYVEIGNENWGSEYVERYRKFYTKLKEAYPDVIYISNMHTEREGCTTEYVDEHYYNTPEFFLENTGMFQDRDRKGPKIFLGEYAVNGGKTIASMECALAEAAFLVGVENNQDIVKLTAYAPLFQNADYTGWKPNLIVFNHSKVYGIPTYQVLSLFGRHRGSQVVTCKVECENRLPVYQGIPGIMCEKEGLVFKNAKVNGKKVQLNRMIYGEEKQTDDGMMFVFGGKNHHYTGKSDAWNKAFEKFIASTPFGQKPVIWGVFGKEDQTEHVFEVDMRFERENPVTISVWNFRPDTDAGCNEPRDMEWTTRGVRNQIWRLENGKSATREPGLFETKLPDAEQKEVDLDFSQFHTYKIIARKEGYDCLIDDILVEHKTQKKYPEVIASASIDNDCVIVKVVSTAEEEKEIEIILDCDIQEEAEVNVISAPLDACNSFEEKDRVSCSMSKIKCEKNRVNYKALAYSVSVLVLKRAEV